MLRGYHQLLHASRLFTASPSGLASPKSLSHLENHWEIQQLKQAAQQHPIIVSNYYKPFILTFTIFILFFYQ